MIFLTLAGRLCQWKPASTLSTLPLAPSTGRVAKSEALTTLEADDVTVEVGRTALHVALADVSRESAVDHYEDVQFCWAY